MTKVTFRQERMVQTWLIQVCHFVKRIASQQRNVFLLAMRGIDDDGKIQ